MNANKQFDLIKRGTVEIIEESQLKEKLKGSAKNKRPLVVKVGFDPTVPDIHLGHTVLLRKMGHFQDLGHKVIFLIGDATGLVGDPSGQSQTRKTLTWDEVEKNARTYEQQVSKILNVKDQKVFERRHNSEWFPSFPYPEDGRHKHFGFEQLVELGQRYTIARLLERDDFQKRLKENKPISFLELFYPLMQGYDSVHLKADVEIGGTDQKFNMLVGRNLQRAYNQEPQIVITMPLLEGTDGVQKMSKSFGNYIGITESARDMFGKIMSVSDKLMWKYYELLTDISLKEISDMKDNMHPMDAKAKLAREIVTTYHSKKEAEKAEKEFGRIFKAKGVPEDIKIYTTRGNQKVWIVELLEKQNLASSRSEARRLIKQGAVKIDGNRVSDENLKFNPKNNSIIQVGKRRFLKIKKEQKKT